MSNEVTTSEAARRAQERGGDNGQPEKGATVPAAASEAGQGAQEQRHEGDSQVSTEELQRRQEQSIRDRIRHEARIEAQRLLEEKTRQEQAAREQRMIEEMDDEDYGRYVREKQSREAAQSQSERDALVKGFQRIQAETLASISDPGLREELAAKADSGEIKTFQEFMQAAVQAEASAIALRQLEQQEKELRESLLNERLSDDADFAAPQAGTGVPTAALNPKKMSATQKMALGWQKGPARRQ